MFSSAFDTNDSTAQLMRGRRQITVQRSISVKDVSFGIIGVRLDLADPVGDGTAPRLTQDDVAAADLRGIDWGDDQIFTVEHGGRHAAAARPKAHAQTRLEQAVDRR